MIQQHIAIMGVLFRVFVHKLENNLRHSWRSYVIYSLHVHLSQIKKQNCKILCFSFLQGVPKRFLRTGLIFNPKIVTVGSGVDQNKKLTSFWLMDQKMLIYIRILSFWYLEKIFHWKRAIFDQYGSKIWQFLFWSTSEPMVSLLG